MARRLFILDESGSMSPWRSDTIGGYNTFVSEQKDLGGTLTLCTFSSDHTIVYHDKPIADVLPLTDREYAPGGNTALLDACGYALTFSDRFDIVVILTDGEENSSKKYRRDAIKELIDAQTKLGTTFMYMGANQDAFHEAGNMGIQMHNILEFSQQDTPNAFTQMARGVRARSTGDESTPVTPITQYEY